MRTVFFALILLFILTLSAAAESLGLLPVKNMYILYIDFINLAPELPETLGKNNKKLLLLNSYANTSHLDRNWLYSDIAGTDFFADIDMETEMLSADFDYGLTEKLDLGFSASVSASWGGFLDPLIQGFHHLFSFPNGDRGIQGDNHFRLYLKKNNVTWTDKTSPLLWLGGLTLKAKYQLPQIFPYLTSALQAGVKLPFQAGYGPYKTTGPDYAVNFISMLRAGPFIIHNTLGYLRLSEISPALPFPYRRDLFNFDSALEWPASGRLSFYFQVNGSGSPYCFDHPWIDRPSAVMSFGLAKQLDKSTILHLFFSEEFIWFAAPDISGSAALSFYF
jgi:hypothetical protein